MKVFVTGATGFLGSHIARVLADQGASLRLLVRPTSDLRNIADIGGDQVYGDLRDSDSIEKALSGCEVVFHAAADYRLWVRDPHAMWRPRAACWKRLASKRFAAWCTRRASHRWVLATVTVRGMALRPTRRARF